MSLRLPPYQPLPPPGEPLRLLEVAVAELQPTQLCVGLAEVRSRQSDFRADSLEQRLQYLQRKPVPLVRNRSGALWMVDRHHRLRSLLEFDPAARAYGYVVLEVDSNDRAEVLQSLQAEGLALPGRWPGPWSAPAHGPAAHPARSAGRSLPQFGLETEEGKADRTGSADPLPRVPLGRLVTPPQPAPVSVPLP